MIGTGGIGVLAVAAGEAPVAPALEDIDFEDDGLIDVVYLVILEPFQEANAA